MYELTETQRALQASARRLAVEKIAPRAAEVDRSEAYPWDNVALLRVLVIEEMAKVCGVTARIVVEANMGAVGAIIAYGNEAQRQLAARQVLGGDKPAICITEPGAGSAATEMTTTARRRGDAWIWASPASSCYATPTPARHRGW